MALTLTQALEAMQRGKTEGEFVLSQLEKEEKTEAEIEADCRVRIESENMGESYLFWYGKGFMSAFDDYME